MPSIGILDLLDILVVAVLLYWVLLLIRGTRAVQILMGLLLLVGLFALSKRIGLVTSQWVVGNFLGAFVVIVVVIFQDEIRRGLGRVGQARIFRRFPGGTRADFLRKVAGAAFRLAETRTGAILLLEREVGLSEHVEHGRKLDAIFSYELLAGILSPSSPVHDGAVVIREERVAAAGVILPIPGDSQELRGMGTRHRAAFGVTAETDAVAVVVSEETGRVTLFHNRQAEAVESPEDLQDRLSAVVPG